MKRIIIIYLVVICLLANGILVSANNDDSYRCCCEMEWDSIEDLQPYIQNDITTYATLPSYCDNTNNFPQPGSQGALGSCVSWAVAYALKSEQEYTKRNWNISLASHNFSPSFSHASMALMSEGSTIKNALNVTISLGACPLSYCEYDANSVSAPTPIQLAAASLYKSASFNIVTTIPAIKNRIANGDGVVIGINTYPDFNNISNSNPIFDTISGEKQGGHAICLIGYDDSLGAFKFVNSWGTDWGLDGYGWISYELLQNKNVNHYGESYGFVLNNKQIDDYIMGDINNDGNVNASDARLALRFSAQLETFTDIQYVLADVDGDASVTASDSRYITLYSSMQIPNLPLYD